MLWFVITNEDLRWYKSWKDREPAGALPLNLCSVKRFHFHFSFFIFHFSIFIFHFSFSFFIFIFHFSFFIFIFHFSFFIFHFSFSGSMERPDINQPLFRVICPEREI